MLELRSPLSDPCALAPVLTRPGGSDAVGAALKLQADMMWLGVAPVDMRTSIDGLSLHGQQALGRPLCDGTAYKVIL